MQYIQNYPPKFLWADSFAFKPNYLDSLIVACGAIRKRGKDEYILTV